MTPKTQKQAQAEAVISLGLIPDEVLRACRPRRAHKEDVVKTAPSTHAVQRIKGRAQKIMQHARERLLRAFISVAISKPYAPKAHGLLSKKAPDEF